MKRAVAWAPLAALLSGCMVGPDFHRPAVPEVTRYRPAGDALALSTDGAPVQRVDPAATIDFDWWRLFQSRALDELVARAIANNPGVDGAQQRLRAAQAQLRAGYGGLFPAIGVTFDATRQKYSPSRLGQNGSGSVFSLFTPSVLVSYALDLFGGTRRTVEGLKARAEQQQQVVRGTYLTLATTVASTAIARAQYHDQVDALTGLVAAEREQVRLAAVRVRAGTATLASELALEAELDTTRAALSAAAQKASQADSLLVTLLGDPPAASSLPELRLADLHLPDTVPLRLPASLVRQRPDILAAEAAAHAASADVGVATAAMLPSITLTAGMGSSANGLSQLFAAGTGVWNYGASVAAPIFEGGALRNRQAASKALLSAALADYRQTVLQAFDQVADALNALDHDAISASALEHADQDAETAYRLVAVNRTAGLASDADLQLSQAQLQQARVAMIAARAARLQDCVALLGALGGGWWEAKSSH